VGVEQDVGLEEREPVKKVEASLGYSLEQVVDEL
jgi:hypothetical protein